MVLLSSIGWPAPRSASSLGSCVPTVWGLRKDFRARGTAAFFPRHTGPPPDVPRRRQVTAALTELLGQERTWTSPQLAAVLAERGIALSPRQVRRYLGMLQARWRRTTNSLRHKQDPAQVARAERVLDNWKKKRPPAA
jgi:transposase